MAVVLIEVPEIPVTFSDDQDVVFDIDYDDGDLTGVPLRLTIREDPDWPRKPLVSDQLRGEFADVEDWEAVVTSTTTVTPATGYAAAVSVDRAAMSELLPGKYRYCLEISRTDSGSVSPVVSPLWISVRPAVSR